MIQKHLEFFRHDRVLGNNGDITDFNESNADTNLFILKVKLTRQTGNNGAKYVEIMLPLKYLSNFCRTLERSLINCEISLDLNWSENLPTTIFG